MISEGNMNEEWLSDIINVNTFVKLFVLILILLFNVTPITGQERRHFHCEDSMVLEMADIMPHHT